MTLKIVVILLVVISVFVYNHPSQKGRRKCLNTCKLSGVDEVIYTPEKKPSSGVLPRGGVTAYINLGHPETCICVTEEFKRSKKEKFEMYRCIKELTRRYPNGKYPDKEISKCKIN